MANKHIPWELIISHLKQDTTQEEEKTLADWRTSPDNNSVYMELEAVWYEVCKEAGEYNPDVNLYWKKLEARIDTKKEKTNRLSFPKYKIATIAASFLLLVSVPLAYELGKKIATPEPTIQTYSALSGKSQLILPDGTCVWLNIGSTLTCETPFTDKREIKLTGEALFEVTKDKEHPFIVHSGDVQVKVYGTRFCVNAYPVNNNLKIALLEGKVSLQAGGQETFLKPGELASYDKQTKALHIEPADINFETCWANNSFTFNAKPLDYICKYLERWYNVNITLTPEIARTCYTFTITDEPLETILQIMARINPIQYSFEENREVIISDVKPTNK